VGQTPAGQPYIAMQYIEGGSLQDKLAELADRKKLLTTEQALNITRQIALALAAAHKAGIVHRDLKPANVLIRPDGTPVLVDLGIAAVQGGAKLTQTGSVIGTPAYMSPEQVRGVPLDGRADLYALGIMLYEMLTGIRPFEADSSIAVLHKQVYEDPLPLDKFRPDLSPQTLQLVATAMQKDPARRYQSAEEMVQAIDAALRAEGLAGPNPQATVVLTQMNDSALLSVSRLTYSPQAAQAAQIGETAAPGRRAIPRWGAALIVALLTGGLLLLAWFFLAPGRGAPEITTSPTSATETAVAAVIPTEEPSKTSSPPPTRPTDTAVPPTNTPTATQTPAPSATPIPTSNVVGGGSGLIAYSAQTDLGIKIFTYDLTTGEIRQRTTVRSDDFGAAWSPDGRQIAYASKRNDQFDIFILNLDTGVTRNLTNAPSDEAYPAWSPDGAQILFHSNRNGHFDIFVVNADGSGLQQLTFNDLPDLGPQWSPDGRQIAFSQSIDNRRQLALMNADRSGFQLLTSDNRNSHSYPVWSPDGQRLAFYMVPELSLTSGIYIIDINNRNIQQVTDGEDFEPDWSPDGQWILFHRRSGGNRVVYRIRPDGTDLTLVTADPPDAREAAWQP
jgi:serine/threonine protein kinase